MSSLFISDLHLKHDSPELSTLACQLFQEFAPRFENLFILGDFVEYWLGDDAYDNSLDSVFNALRNLAQSGVKIRLMMGNRDFLFGKAFATDLSITLIRNDEFLFEDENLQLLLLHGDTLCTDDHAYQQLRKVLRDEHWQSDFLSKSISERIIAADNLRAASREQIKGKPRAIMDVNQKSVEQVLIRNQLTTLIHGHTHRPGVHDFILRGQKARRFVLGDWQIDGAFIVSLEKSELNLFRWPENF